MTGEQITTAARLTELRAVDPGAMAIIRQFDEDDPADQAVLRRYLTFPGSVIASDAMPLTWTGPVRQPDAWPLPPAAITHPRTAGTYARSIRTLGRGGGALSLAEILAQCSLQPAVLLQDRVPALRRKGPAGRCAPHGAARPGRRCPGRAAGPAASGG